MRNDEPRDALRGLIAEFRQRPRQERSLEIPNVGVENRMLIKQRVDRSRAPIQILEGHEVLGIVTHCDEGSLK